MERFDYKMVHSRSMGYCMMKRTSFGRQQCTKWYMYEGNLRRFNACANEPCYYAIWD